MPGSPLAFARRTSRWLAVALTLVGALSLQGCAPKNPQLRVQGANVTGAWITFPFAAGVRVDVVTSAENPNGFDLQVRNVRGQVVFQNQNVIPINVPNLNMWLPAERTTTFAFPTAIPIDVGLRLLSMNVPCIGYTVQGEADVTATSTFKLERNNYPFNQSGCIPRATLLNAIRPYSPTAY